MEVQSHVQLWYGFKVGEEALSLMICHQIKPQHHPMMELTEEGRPCRIRVIAC